MEYYSEYGRPWNKSGHVGEVGFSTQVERQFCHIVELNSRVLYSTGNEVLRKQSLSINQVLVDFCILIAMREYSRSTSGIGPITHVLERIPDACCEFSYNYCHLNCFV